MITEDCKTDDVIGIYFSDEPYVDAIITKEELLAALKKLRGETVVEGVRPFAAKIDKENPVGGKGEKRLFSDCIAANYPCFRSVAYFSIAPSRITRILPPFPTVPRDFLARRCETYYSLN